MLFNRYNSLNLRVGPTLFPESSVTTNQTLHNVFVNISNVSVTSAAFSVFKLSVQSVCQLQLTTQRGIEVSFEMTGLLYQ